MVDYQLHSAWDRSGHLRAWSGLCGLNCCLASSVQYSSTILYPAHVVQGPGAAPHLVGAVRAVCTAGLPLQSTLTPILNPIAAGQGSGAATPPGWSGACGQTAGLPLQSTLKFNNEPYLCWAKTRCPHPTWLERWVRPNCWMALSALQGSSSVRWQRRRWLGSLHNVHHARADQARLLTQLLGDENSCHTTRTLTVAKQGIEGTSTMRLPCTGCALAVSMPQGGCKNRRSHNTFLRLW